MYIVSRADLPVAVQAVQAAHAAIAFTAEHPRIPVSDGTLVFLAAPDELALCWLAASASRFQVPVSSFREPDLDDAITAVALCDPESMGRAARLCANYPLALSERTVP